MIGSLTGPTLLFPWEYKQYIFAFALVGSISRYSCSSQLLMSYDLGLLTRLFDVEEYKNRSVNDA
ncbi:hypothetical protein WN944_009020 [Citrus x changshan-huyou]|uniref:Uncharacterized protein n=1 Tax=Citrus x changshan-huyou TaxID=2935761 RepID=A0AAP0MNZ5_9ROSI